MAKENLEQFCLAALQNPALQNKLKNIIDRDEFLEKVRELGAASGYDFSREDIERQMRENRKLWNDRWI